MHRPNSATVGDYTIMIKKILVSQSLPSTGKNAYEDLEEQFGLECVFRPFFKVEGLTAKQFREQRVHPLDYQAVIFNSRLAVDYYFMLAKEMRLVIPETMKYFCTLEAIALYIQKYVQFRKRKVFFSNSGKIDDLIPQMNKQKNCKFLVPLSNVHSDELSETLGKHGLQHKVCTMYNTVTNDFTDEEKANFDYDMILFFSPSGVKTLKSNFPEFKQDKIIIGAFGPATAKAVEDEGLRVDISAPTEKYPSMPLAVKAYLRQQE